MMNYEKLNKKAIGCMLVAEMIGFAFFLAIGVLVLVLNDNLPVPVRFGIYCGIGVCFLVALISPKVRYERYRYRITDEELDIKEGFLWVNRNIVPIERLHKIQVQRGPIDRIFGLAKVSVTTAGGDVTIRFLEDAKADFIADSLKTKINEEASIAKEYRSENKGGTVQ